MTKIAIGRMSHSQPSTLRLVADPAQIFGTTFVPLTFDNENEANAEIANRGEGFFLVPLDTANVPTPAQA